MSDDSQNSPSGEDEITPAEDPRAAGQKRAREAGTSEEGPAKAARLNDDSSAGTGSETSAELDQLVAEIDELAAARGAPADLAAQDDGPIGFPQAEPSVQSEVVEIESAESDKSSIASLDSGLHHDMQVAGDQAIQDAAAALDQDMHPGLEAAPADDIGPASNDGSVRSMDTAELGQLNNPDGLIVEHFEIEVEQSDDGSLGEASTVQSENVSDAQSLEMTDDQSVWTVSSGEPVQHALGELEEDVLVSVGEAEGAASVWSVSSGGHAQAEPGPSRDEVQEDKQQRDQNSRNQLDERSRDSLER
jgi:hypothetical protein